jgi:hypothetical protein
MRAPTPTFSFSVATWNRLNFFSPPAQILGMYLASVSDDLAYTTRVVPGLWHRLDPLTLVERACPRTTDGPAALAELEAAGYLEADWKARVVRVRSLPDAPPGPLSVRGWFTSMQEMQDHPFKTAHVASLRRAVDLSHNANVLLTWRETFGGEPPLQKFPSAVVGGRLRLHVLSRDGFRCRYCGARAGDVILHVDHIVSRALGGSRDMSNLVAACEACNRAKGALLLRAL